MMSLADIQARRAAGELFTPDSIFFLDRYLSSRPISAPQSTSSFGISRTWIGIAAGVLLTGALIALVQRRRR